MAQKTKLVKLDTYAQCVITQLKAFRKHPETLPALMIAIDKMESFMKEQKESERDSRQLKLQFV